MTTHHTPHSKGKVDKHLHGDLVFFDPFESNNKPRYFYRRPSGFEFFSSGDGRLPCLQLAEGVLDPLKQMCGKSKDKKCKMKIISAPQRQGRVGNTACIPATAVALLQNFSLSNCRSK